jgi:hypothetical protein
MTKYIRWLRFALLFQVLITHSAISSSQTKVPIHMDITIAQNDSIGAQLAFEIKENIRGSRAFRLVEDGNEWPYIRYVIVTLPNEGRTQTYAAHTFTFDSTDMRLSGALITSSIQLCGASVVRGCASRLMGTIDSAVQQLQQAAPELWRQLR